MRSLLLLSLLALTGCATVSDREAAAEARGYERGYRQAVKEQYWILQNQQREPDRAVEFLDEPLAGPDRRPPAPEALHTLLERAKQSARLATQFPAIASTVERAEPGSVTLYRDFTITVEEVFRFEAEDTLILRLRFENAGDTVVRYDAHGLAVRVGPDVFPAALAEASGAIPPRTTTRGFVAVSGAPHGGRANLSVRESFSVIVPHA